MMTPRDFEEAPPAPDGCAATYALERGPRLSAGRAALFGLLILLGLGACDGRNLFQPVTDPPTIIALTAPPTADLGQPMLVSVRAVGVAPLDSLVITVEGGGIETDLSIEFEEEELDVTRSIEFQVPTSVDASLLTVRVVAVDQAGNRSAPRNAAVALLDRIPPDVSGSLGAGTVGQGELLEIQAAASDNMSLDRIGMRARLPDGTLGTTDVRPVSGSAAEATFAWDVPVDQALGTYEVEVYADDRSSNRTVTSIGTVEVQFRDYVAPDVTIEAPEVETVFGAGDSIFVRVRIQDAGGFQSVRIEGLAFRGDPDLGTDVTVDRFEEWTIELNEAVTDTTLTRYLRPTGEEDTAEPVTVIVTATDLAENEGSDSVQVHVDPDVDPSGAPQS